MLDNPALAKALVGAEASNSVATVKYAAPTADEKRVSELIAHEVGRIEAKLSVMLAHIEGNYESHVANLKLEVARLKPRTSRGFFHKVFSPRIEIVDHHSV
jgi:phage host-nuclease inhibitor protein Gam